MNFGDFGQGLGIGKEQNMFAWDKYIQRINSVQTDYKTTAGPASSMSNNQEQNELSTISNRSNSFFKSDTNNMQRLQNDQISQGMLDVNNFEGSRLSKKQESSQRNFDDDEDIFKSIKSDIYQNQCKVLPINKLMNLNPEDHTSTQTSNK
ncbi:hypothetical protein OXYTRIMIC_088 [Oxytricha trifallax]|uniref:Uncharacterized protein n=1 Tax=Oxytricha trifallax TaxID=1172189 RepID=A0A073I118_9SPIT|nr:hypothetical protein OXYTRIMIC_088 [Oxytricha trifallax]